MVTGRSGWARWAGAVAVGHRFGCSPTAAANRRPAGSLDGTVDLHTRRARLLLTAGTVVVAGASTVVALAAGTAAADEPGRCAQHVNVREHPAATSRIVALCEAGTPVVLGEERAGWVRLDELGGWISTGHVTTSGAAGRGDGVAGLVR